MFDQGNTWKSICGSEIEKKTIIYLPKNPQKVHITSRPIKSILTIKNVTHLTIGIKFNAWMSEK